MSAAQQAGEHVGEAPQPAPEGTGVRGALASPSLHDLPDELLTSHVFPNLDTRTRWSVLPLVCRSWQKLMDCPSPAWARITIPDRLRLFDWSACPARATTLHVLLSRRARVVAPALCVLRCGSGREDVASALLSLAAASGCPQLHTLALRSAVTLQYAALLRRLTRLKRLQLTVAVRRSLAGADAAQLDMHALGTLSQLRSLRLRFVDGAALMPAALVSLTSLTELVLHNDRSAVGALAAALPPRAPLAAYFPRGIGRLSRLQHLEADVLGPTFPAFVTSLTALTRLSLAFLPLPHAASAGGAHAGGGGAGMAHAEDDEALAPGRAPAVVLPLGMSRLASLRALRLHHEGGGLGGLQTLTALPSLESLALLDCSLGAVPEWRPLPDQGAAGGAQAHGGEPGAL